MSAIRLSNREFSNQVHVDIAVMKIRTYRWLDPINDYGEYPFSDSSYPWVWGPWKYEALVSAYRSLRRRGIRETDLLEGHSISTVHPDQFKQTLTDYIARFTNLGAEIHISQVLTPEDHGSFYQTVPGSRGTQAGMLSKSELPIVIIHLIEAGTVQDKVLR